MNSTSGRSGKQGLGDELAMVRAIRGASQLLVSAKGSSKELQKAAML